MSNHRRRDDGGFQSSTDGGHIQRSDGHWSGLSGESMEHRCGRWWAPADAMSSVAVPRQCLADQLRVGSSSMEHLLGRCESVCSDAGRGSVLHEEEEKALAEIGRSVSRRRWTGDKERLLELVLEDQHEEEGDAVTERVGAVSGRRLTRQCMNGDGM